MIKIKMTIKGDVVTKDIILEGLSDMRQEKLAQRLFHIEKAINDDGHYMVHIEVTEEP